MCRGDDSSIGEGIGTRPRKPKSKIDLFKSFLDNF